MHASLCFSYDRPFSTHSIWWFYGTHVCWHKNARTCSVSLFLSRTHALASSFSLPFYHTYTHTQWGIHVFTSSSSSLSPSLSFASRFHLMSAGDLMTAFADTIFAGQISGTIWSPGNLNQALDECLKRCGSVLFLFAVLCFSSLVTAIVFYASILL